MIASLREKARTLKDEVDTAATQLLIELAFLVPKGTDFNTHPISKCLTRYKTAIEAVTERKTIQRDAQWMQHLGNCAVYASVSSATPASDDPRCTCGLSDRLKALEP